MSKVKKSELKNALEIVKPALANKEIIEQTTSFAFVDGKVVTYNDEICVSHPLQLDIKGAIKAEELYKFLGKITVDEIDITQEDSEVIMKAGRAKVGFAIATEIQLPLTEEINIVNEWKKLPKNFLKAVNFAIPCTAADMSNPKITCVHFNKTGVVEATDNYRIVHTRLEKQLPFETTLVPSISLKEVVKLAPTHVSQGNGWLHFKNENDTVISCRVFKETFPNTKDFIEGKSKGTTFTFPEEITEIITRAEIFTKVQAKSLHDETIEVSYKEGTLLIESHSETAWFKERVKIKNAKAEDFNFQITPYLLRDILKETTTCTLLPGLLRFESADWVYITTLKVTV